MKKDEIKNKELNNYIKLRAHIKWECCRRNPEFQKEYKQWKQHDQRRREREEQRFKEGKKVFITGDPKLGQLVRKWAGLRRYPLGRREPFPGCFEYFNPVETLDLKRIVGLFIDENLKLKKSKGRILPKKNPDRLHLEIDITHPRKYLLPCVESAIRKAQEKRATKGLLILIGKGVARIPSGKTVRKFREFDRFIKKEDWWFSEMLRIWDLKQEEGLTSREIAERVFPKFYDKNESATIDRVKKHLRRARRLIVKREYLHY